MKTKYFMTLMFVALIPSIVLLVWAYTNEPEKAEQIPCYTKVCSELQPTTEELRVKNCRIAGWVMLGISILFLLCCCFKCFLSNDDGENTNNQTGLRTPRNHSSNSQQLCQVGDLQSHCDPHAFSERSHQTTELSAFSEQVQMSSIPADATLSEQDPPSYNTIQGTVEEPPPSYEDVVGHTNESIV